MTFIFEKRAAILIVALIYIIWIFLTNFILARMFIAVAMEGFELYRGEKYQIQLNKFIKNIHGLKQREESYPIR
jgi:Flp pilus assembly protein TadB